MKTMKRLKQPVRKFFKNWFGQGGETHENQVSPASASTHDLPTPQAVTTEVNLVGLPVDNKAPKQETATETTITEVVETEVKQAKTADDHHEDLVMNKDNIVESALCSIDCSENNAILQKILAKMVAQVPECKGVAYVDMENICLLGIATEQSLPEPIQLEVANAAYEMFNVPSVVKIANFFKAYKGIVSDEPNFDQISIRGSDIFVFNRTSHRQDRVAVFSFYNTVSLGMMHHQINMAMPEIEALMVENS